AVAAVFREAAGRLVAGLVRFLGDFDLAEELVQEALLSAVESWPGSGIPDNPAAWLTTTARRKAIDRLRRESRYRDKLVLLAGSPVPTASEPDDRLRLIFTSCPPALARGAQLALTLRAACGLTTAQIPSGWRPYLPVSCPTSRRCWAFWRSCGCTWRESPAASTPRAA